MFWCSNWRSVTTTPKVLIRSLVEEICIHACQSPYWLLCFRIQFEIVLLVFQTTPLLLGLLSSLSSGDGGVCPFPSLCLFSLLQQTPCCWVKNCLLSWSPIQNWLLVHVPQSLILLQSFIRIMLFSPGIQLSFSICSYWMHNSGSYKALRGSGWVSSVVFVSHCSSSWEQAGENCNVFEEVIWNVKIMLQSCLICNCLKSN